MNKYIFLDIDGTLNKHAKFSNGYCGIEHENVVPFNYILKKVPDARIIISSAWRYLILNGSMEIRGFEQLLLSHGIDCENKVEGCTERDEPLPKQLTDEWGLVQRVKQIKASLIFYGFCKYVVLDDLPLKINNLIKTKSDIGLTKKLARQAIEILEN